MRVLFKHPLRRCRAFTSSSKKTMSIRNATIARRKRTIGLSEQERAAVDVQRRRRTGKSGQAGKREAGPILARTEYAGRRHAIWAEW